MRGTYRIKRFLHRRKMRRLLSEAERQVARFPTITQRKAHGLGHPLIVSLTSYPPRYDFLTKTIRSLLDQTVKADHTILWIDQSDEAAPLPQSVLDLRERGLEIRSCPDWRSYSKLIPALAEHPEATIVTTDDDVFYRPDWLETLVETSKRHPKEVVGTRLHLAPLKVDGRFENYSDWTLASHLQSAPDAGSRLFPTGVGGVLYPPGAFDPQVMDDALFMRLAPRGDDIWFFWMARMAGTTQRRTAQWFDLVEWPSSQDVALAVDNLHGEGNDRQIRAMEEHFGPVP